MTAPQRTILITGAGSGLGRGLAITFAQAGHRVLVTDRDHRAAQETLAEAGPHAGSMHAYALDVTAPEAVSDFGGVIASAPVDVLINNAGMQHVARLEDFPQEAWDRLIDVMLGGTARLTRLVLPGMRARNFGRIVNIGSVHALVASPFKSAYVAAKHGILGFAKVVALENADVDITINTICPAYIRTPLVEAQIRGQAEQHGIPEEDVIQKIMLEPMPKKAFISVEEVAAAVDYLASRAARNVTAQTITIDGGWTAR